MEQRVLERFLSKCDRPVDGCWLWEAGITTAGYGTLSIASRTHYAHRLAYEHFIGPIEDGMVIDHLCRMRHCVNPAHLEVVTNAENLRRGYVSRTGRNPRPKPAPRPKRVKRPKPEKREPRNFAQRTHCKWGHEWTAENIVIRAGYRKCRLCAVDAQRRWEDRRKST